MRKRLTCKIIGHKRTTVTAVKYEDGSVRYISHPLGERIGCRRCRNVLKDR